MKKCHGKESSGTKRKQWCFPTNDEPIIRGALPAPADFAAYKETLPSAPERIMVMAEEEQRYRQKINNKVVNFGLIESILGMCFAFTIVLCIIAAAIYLAMNDHEWIASIMVGITATLAAIFYLKKEPTGK